MPIAPLVSPSELLARGLRTEFAETYTSKIKGADSRIARFMQLGMPSDKTSEIYGYLESTPHLKRWPVGEEIPASAMRARNYQVPNYDFGLKISWHENNEMDDQSRSLVPHVRQAASDAALLAERVAFQFILGATDNNLLPNVPNAPDGVGLWSSTDALSGNRFGISGGNIVSTSGVASVNAIQTDYFTALNRFGRFQDTDGQPFWAPELIGQGTTIVYGLANEFQFQMAFHQYYNGVVVQNVAGSENVGGMTRSNATLEAMGYAKPLLFGTPRITNNTWYVFMNAADVKPLFEQVRQPIRDNMEDMLNSDRTRATKIKAMQWDGRFGYGINLPLGAIQVA